jgi:hypothetical protein
VKNKSVKKLNRQKSDMRRDPAGARLCVVNRTPAKISDVFP